MAPVSSAYLVISSLFRSFFSSFWSSSIFFLSASCFCSAFQTRSMFFIVWGCQLFFRFCQKRKLLEMTMPTLNSTLWGYPNLIWFLKTQKHLAKFQTHMDLLIIKDTFDDTLRLKETTFLVKRHFSWKCVYRW